MNSDEEIEPLVVKSLRSKNIKLWLSPYNDSESKIKEVAEEISAEINERNTEKVLSCLFHLRSRALEKLEAKRYNIRVIVRVAGQLNNSIEMCLNGKIYGHQAKSEIATAVGMNKIYRVLVRGRKLLDDSRLLDQGLWTSTEKPLRLLAFACPQEIALDVLAPPPEIALAQAAALLAEKDDLVLGNVSSVGAVSFNKEVKISLVTGITLHAKGRALLDTSSGRSEAVAASIPYLIDADHAFRRVVSLGVQTMIENFALNKLDICRAYAIIEDVSVLPDAQAQLEDASIAINKRIDPRFREACLEAARQGRKIPPEIIPFARLTLLEAIVDFQHGTRNVKQKFQDATYLFNALRIPQHLIEPLLLLGVSRNSAIAAIRRAEGNIDNAATAILDARTKNQTESIPIDAHKLDELRRLAPSTHLETAVNALRHRNNNLNAALNDLLDNSVGHSAKSPQDQESNSLEKNESQDKIKPNIDPAEYARARSLVEREVGSILQGEEDIDALHGCDLHLEDILLARWAPNY